MKMSDRLRLAEFLILLDDYDELIDDRNDLEDDLDDEWSKRELRVHKKKLKEKEEEVKKFEDILNKKWNHVKESIEQIITKSEEVDFYLLTQTVGAKNKMKKLKQGSGL